MSKRPPKTGPIIEAKHTLLIDGNALFKAGFFGAKDEYNHHGEHIGGIYQFLTVLRKVLTEELYHRVYVFWDGNYSGKLRYNIYEPYKSGRGKNYIDGTEPVDESELKQRAALASYLNELYIRQLKHEIIESDDFIAYYCLIRQPHEKVTIVTNDRDMCQLIEPNVRVYFCDLKEYVDSSNYNQYFNHHRDNAALIKTISGDNSDSIKGIKGVKEATLLSLFPELKERKVTIKEIVTRAVHLQQERLNNKQKPLKTLTNISECITDGVQGKQLYEINSQLVDLKRPMLTEDGIRSLEHLIDGDFDFTDTSFKNVLMMMKVDGLERVIGASRYPEYLLPFKKLLEREIKKSNNYEQQEN
jgi:5'-3' exonuclease